jgi:hypothetical protein
MVNGRNVLNHNVVVYPTPSLFPLRSGVGIWNSNNRKMNTKCKDVGIDETP